MPPTDKLQLVDIKKIVESQRNYTIEQIHKTLEGRKSYHFTLEQKILILKYLQLTDMDYTKTSRDLNVSRPVLYKWKEDYGETVFNAEPEARISERIETDLAMIKNDAMVQNYQNIQKTLTKFNELIELAKTPRQIHAVSEAFLAMVEFAKLEKANTLVQPQINDFYMQIHNLMLTNIKPKDGNKG